MDTLKLGAAGVFALVAVVTWAAFLRPGTRGETTGVITDKQHRAASNYQRTLSGPGGGVRQTSIPIAESYVFTVRLDGGDTLHVSLNEVMSRQFEPGQRVRVTTERRGLGPIGARTRALEMTRVE
jgi:hypothetical protein